MGKRVDDVMNGKTSLGDAISSAVTDYVGKWFGQSPIIQDLDQAARRAQAQAQARARPPGGGSSPPPPRQPSASSPPPPRPPPRPPVDPRFSQARTILGFEPNQKLSAELVNDRRKQLAKVFHPDRPGGSTPQMQRVNAAADLLIAQLGKQP